jgi:hypothetical protein
MTKNWIPAGKDFIEADVIRWTEGVWRQRRSKRAKAVKTGFQQVTTEVLKDEGDWLHLLVRECIQTIEKPEYKSDPSPKKNTELRRKRATIEKSNPERLLWSDESARIAALAGSKS